VRLSNTHFDLSQPYWQDYRVFLQQLSGETFPDCDELNALLPDSLRSTSGQTIHFTPSTELDDTAYEQRIHHSGQVSTRPDSWHDLFNALVWMRFPRLKVAMNALHYQSDIQTEDGTRGSQRDALTLFDECGVVVFSSDLAALTALAHRNWPEVFQAGQQPDLQVGKLHYIISGHAMLEKYLSPYKSMTAKALLVHLDGQLMSLPREDLLGCLDEQLASLLLAGELLTKPAELTPLPLAGIPGWWSNETQNEEFYADQHVFRSPPAGMSPVSIIKLQ